MKKMMTNSKRRNLVSATTIGTSHDNLDAANGFLGTDFFEPDPDFTEGVASRAMARLLETMNKRPKLRAI